MQNKSKEEISAAHLRDLRLAGELTSVLLEKLEVEIYFPDDGDEGEAGQRNSLCASKENEVTILGKLVQILLKIIPMEQQLMQSSSQKQVWDKGKITKQDIEILKHYIERNEKTEQR